MMLLSILGLQPPPLSPSSKLPSEILLCYLNTNACVMSLCSHT